MKTLFFTLLPLYFFIAVNAQSCITITDDQNPGKCNYTFCGPYDFSKGVYRLPYPDGTKVHCTNDHMKHCPRGAIDMSGASGQSSYNIVAAADGWIRSIHDEGTVQCTCENGDNCDNNYVWIEHPNGEWTKYTHVKHNSVDDLGLQENDWVTRGTVIGKEGTVGCSTGDHCHFEVAVPIDTNTLIFDSGGGWIDGDWARNLVPVFCSISGNKMVSGVDYIAMDCFGNCNASLPSTDISYGSGIFKVFMDQNEITNNHDFIFQSNSSGELHAANEITLSPGFEAQWNATFAARIGPCDGSALKAETADDWPATFEIGQITLFPNPASSRITLEMQLDHSLPYQIRINDVSGRTVFMEEQLPPLSGHIQHTIATNMLTDGFYVIEVHQQLSKWIGKFAIQQ